MIRRLDDIDEISRLDASKMLEAINDSPDQLQDCDKYEVALKRSKFSNLVLMGMGGSASAADVVHNWLRTRIEIPSIVLRDPSLPGFVGPETIFVVISYSGNTTETLNAARAAKRRGSTIIGIGTGGRLASFCNNYRRPFVTVPQTVAPRAALPQLIAALGTTLERLGIVRNIVKEMVDSGTELTSLRKRLVAEVPTDKNLAKQLALRLQRHFMMIYALERMSSVARRFKNQLAENSKLLSKYDILPEAGHNEVEAWRKPGLNVLPVILRDSRESQNERRLVHAFESTITSASGTRPVNVRVPARNSLGRLVAPIFLLDYVSVYLALLRGVDPTPTELISKYKRS